MREKTPDTITEKAFFDILSGAGGAMARRRRDLFRSSRYLRSLLLFSFLLFSFLSLNLPKNPNLSSSSVYFFSDRQLCNGVREQCFIISLNQTSPIKLSWIRATEVLHKSNNDAAGQIWGLNRSGKQTKPDPASPDDAFVKIWGFYRSGKQTTPDPAIRPSSRHKSTKNRRPLPPPSTLTPAPPSPSPARKSMPPTRNPANLLEPQTAPSTLTPAHPSPARRSMPSTMTPAKPPCLTLPSTGNPATTPVVERPPLDLTMGMATGETLILQMGCTLGMGLDRVWLDGLSLPLGFTSGPLRVLTRPTSNLVCPTQSTDWPRDHKVLAQHLKEAIEDLFHTAASFQSLSFRFIPRSQNTLVDDLVKNAIRSMTSGYLYVL